MTQKCPLETHKKKKVSIDKMPAKLDYLQSMSGLILALFISAHLFFEASIIFGFEAMYFITNLFEGYYFFGEKYPFIISILAGAIFFIFIVHAFIAIRKFPASYREYKIIKNHTSRMNHQDTSLWPIQAITGFMMFFLGSVHLYMMMSNPADIGPYASSDRIYSEWMWTLYLLLIFSVVSHAAIGAYRLCLKWGWFEGSNPKKSRPILRKTMYGIIIFYITMSLYSLSVYFMIGYNHSDNVGERYSPTQVTKETK
ncbi:MAG: fumarate reductase cytochrome b subunit [Campylobacterota bacterium]|nr:fumarate reductase cytochrome b subunit [Campylobacterota bacterium]